jgi:hypothetical protein
LGATTSVLGSVLWAVEWAAAGDGELASDLNKEAV